MSNARIFLTSDAKGKAIYKGDTIHYKLQPEARLKAVETVVDPDGSVYIICEPFRKASVSNCISSRHTMAGSSFYNLTKRKK